MVGAKFQHEQLIRNYKQFVCEVSDKEVDLLLFIRCAKIHVFM